MQAAAQEDFVIPINGKSERHLLWFASEDDAFDHELTETFSLILIFS